MKRLGLLLVLALSLAGCSATKKVAPSITATQEAAALVGNWTGTATGSLPTNSESAVGSIPVLLSSQDGQNFTLTLGLSAFNPGACEDGTINFNMFLSPAAGDGGIPSFVTNLSQVRPGYVMFSPSTDGIGLSDTDGFGGNFISQTTSPTTLSITMTLQTQVPLSSLNGTEVPSACVPLQQSGQSSYAFTLTKQPQ